MFGRSKQKMKERLGKATATEEPPEFLALLEDLKIVKKNFEKIHKKCKSVFDSEKNGDSRPPPHDNFTQTFIQPAVALRKKYKKALVNMDAKNTALLEAKPEKKEEAAFAAEKAKEDYAQSKKMLRGVIDGINEKKNAIFAETISAGISIVNRITPPWEGYVPSTPKFVTTSAARIQLTEDQLIIVQQMLGIDGVKIEDRKYHMKTYSQCFIASELVDWMVKQGVSQEREEAVETAEKLRQLQVFHHSPECKVFDDAFSFYQFNLEYQPMRESSDPQLPTAHLAEEPEVTAVKEIDDSSAIMNGQLLLLSSAVSESTSMLPTSFRKGSRQTEEKWDPIYCVAKMGIFTWCAASITGPVLGKFDLSNATLLENPIHVDHRQAFTLRDDEKNVSYHLDPTNVDNREQWIPSLCLAIPTKLFGVPLGVAAERSDPEQLVPSPLKIATEWLNLHSLNEVGLYRIPGSKDEVDKWINLFDKGNEVVIPEQYAGSNLASLIVQYLRRLPESLMTSQYSAVFQTIADDEDKDENTRLEIMKKLLMKLPPSNYASLQVLCYHLYQVSLYAEENQMDASKLAMCVYTTCARPLQMMIYHYCWMFDDEEE